jgi:hypothetical protein
MSIYSDVILAKHPVAYYRLNDLGGIAVDSSGNLHDGTLSGSGITKGITGNIIDKDTAMTFDGIAGRIVAPDSVALQFTTAFTIECWIKWTGTPSPFRGILGKYAGNQTGYDLGLGSSDFTKPRMTIRGTGNIDTGSTGPAINDGLWHHVVFVCSFSSILYYLDGIFKTTTNGTWTPVINTSALCIGNRDNLGLTQFFPGSLDEVAIYGYALSQQQILENYVAADTTPFILTNYTFSRDGGRILVRDGIGVTASRDE